MSGIHPPPRSPRFSESPGLVPASDGPAAGASASRRALLSGASSAALSAVFFGGLSARPRVAAAHRPAKCPAGDSAEGSPTIITVDDYQITVEQLESEDPLIGLTIAYVDDPENPIYASTHTGTLTDEMIADIEAIGEVDLGKSDVRLFNALLKKNGLDELALATSGPGGPAGGGIGRSFLLILVLFILLVIVGAGFG